MLAEIEPVIDWALLPDLGAPQPLPQILEESRAKELYDDARKLLHEIIEKRLLKARAVYGLWPAQRDGDDVIVPGATFHTLRRLLRLRFYAGATILAGYFDRTGSTVTICSPCSIAWQTRMRSKGSR